MRTQLRRFVRAPATCDTEDGQLMCEMVPLSFQVTSLSPLTGAGGGGGGGGRGAGIEGTAEGSKLESREGSFLIYAALPQTEFSSSGLHEPVVARVRGGGGAR